MNNSVSFLKLVASDVATDFLFGFMALVLVVALAPTLALYLFIVVSCAVGVIVVALVATVIGHFIKESYNV